MHKNKTRKIEEEKKEDENQQQEMINRMFKLGKKEVNPEEAEYIKRCNESADDIG